jgi:Transglutaminase-like superfamily
MSEGVLLVRAAAVATATALGLRIVGFRRIRQIAARQHSAFTGLNGGRTGRRPSREWVIWAVKAACRRLPGCNNCLVHALAAQYLLAHFGYRAELKIGARHDSRTQFAAHAWLEDQGRVLIGDFELDRYATMVAARQAE